MQVKVGGEHKGCFVLYGVLSTEHVSSKGGVPVLVWKDEGYRPGELVEVESEQWVSLDDILLLPDPVEDPRQARRALDAWHQHRPLAYGKGRKSEMTTTPPDDPVYVYAEWKWWEVLAAFWLWPAYLTGFAMLLIVAVASLPFAAITWLGRQIFSSGSKKQGGP